MGLRINQNIAALNAHRNLVATDNALSKSLERLSSGFRINRAADDAAGLAISEKLRAQVRGLAQAIRNAQDGISMIQTAEGALNEVHSMLQRMRELALQAANDTLSSEDRAAINREIQQLRAEIDNVSQRTTFNGKKLLDGTLAVTVSETSQIKTGAPFSSGGDTVSIVSVDVSGAVGDATYTLEATVSGGNVTFTLKRTVASTTFSESVSGFGDLGPNAEINLAFATMGVTIRVRGDDNGVTAANLAGALNNKNLVTQGQPINLQVGPADRDFIGVSFERVDVHGLGLSTALNSFNTSQTVANAHALVRALDSALSTVSEKRGKFGAVQNRLEHTVASLGVAQENMSAAESRIRDVDMAQEMVQFTRNQILLQAGTAMLAQANAAPQVVLQLLR
jgi:flagellin